MQSEPGKRPPQPSKTPRWTTKTAPRLLLAALLTATACRTPPKPATPQVGWRPIGRWSGYGNDQTDSFNIESGQFRIKWTTSRERKPGEGKLRIMVHSAVSGRPLVLAGEHNGTGHGIDYVNEDPRLFHLVIESQSVDWSVSVEESVVGVPES